MFPPTRKALGMLDKDILADVVHSIYRFHPRSSFPSIPPSISLPRKAVVSSPARGERYVGTVLTYLCTYACR